MRICILISGLKGLSENRDKRSNCVCSSCVNDYAHVRVAAVFTRRALMCLYYSH